MIGSNQSKQEVDPFVGSKQEVSPFLGVVFQMCALPLILAAATLTFLPQWADWVKP